MLDEKFLNDKELKFVSDVIAKELYFSVYSEEDTDVARLIRNYVTWEKEKIDGGLFGEGYEDDSRIAGNILKKLAVTEEE